MSNYTEALNHYHDRIIASITIPPPAATWQQVNAAMDHALDIIESPAFRKMSAAQQKTVEHYFHQLGRQLETAEVG